MNLASNESSSSKEDKTAGILYMERIFVGNLDTDVSLFFYREFLWVFISGPEY